MSDNGNMQKLIKELEDWGAEPEQVLTDTFIDDVPFYKSCLYKFSNDTLLQTLKDSLKLEKIDTAIRAVHTMKGNADSLGLFPILDAAMTVLKDLRAGNLPLAGADMPELENTFSEFKKIIATSLDMDGVI